MDATRRRTPPWVSALLTGLLWTVGVGGWAVVALHLPGVPDRVDVVRCSLVKPRPVDLAGLEGAELIDEVLAAGTKTGAGMYLPDPVVDCDLARWLGFQQAK